MIKPEKAPKIEEADRGAAGNIDAQWESPLESELKEKRKNLKDVSDELEDQKRDLSVLNHDLSELSQLEYSEATYNKMVNIEEEIKETEESIKKLEDTKAILEQEIEDLENQDKN